jgi:uncharacterized membrane protein YbaN (DUF454 family)
MPEKVKKWLFLVAGTLSMALGIIGIFVPVLPTTPFLLLAAACYIRGSPKLYSWLLNNRFLGAYIRDYMQGKGMSLKVKIITLVLLWVTIGLSAAFAVQNVVVRIVLILVAIGVTTHIIRIKTARGTG